MADDRRATTFRTDPSILLAVDRCARNLGLSRNQVLDLVVKMAVDSGIQTMIALAASGRRVEPPIGPVAESPHPVDLVAHIEAGLAAREEVQRGRA